jgi:hypothetical protein
MPDAKRGLNVLFDMSTARSKSTTPRVDPRLLSFRFSQESLPDLADTAASHSNLPCRKSRNRRKFNMPSVSSAPWHAGARRRRRDHADAGLALMPPSEDRYLTLPGFALIAGAPPIAAMAALHFAGNSDEPFSGMRMRES